MKTDGNIPHNEPENVIRGKGKGICMVTEAAI
jgi:hypothetical protein